MNDIQKMFIKKLRIWVLETLVWRLWVTLMRWQQRDFDFMRSLDFALRSKFLVLGKDYKLANFFLIKVLELL